MDIIIQEKKKLEADLLKRIREFEKVLDDFTTDDTRYNLKVEAPQDGYGRPYSIRVEISEYNSKEYKTITYH